MLRSVDVASQTSTTKNLSIAEVSSSPLEIALVMRVTVCAKEAARIGVMSEMVSKCCFGITRVCPVQNVQRQLLDKAATSGPLERHHLLLTFTKRQDIQERNSVLILVELVSR